MTQNTNNKNNTYELTQKGANACVTSIKTTDSFKALLAVAGRFSRYSENNICLIYDQKPTATKIDSYEDWKKKGMPVKKGAKAIRIIDCDSYVGENGKKRKNYFSECRYDISDVQVTSDKVQAENIYSQKELMKALVHSAPAEIIILDDYPKDAKSSAYYDVGDGKIYSTRGLRFEDMFASFAKTVVHANLSQGKEEYRETDNEFLALSVAYSLADKYGVSKEHCNILSLPPKFESMTPIDIKNEVTSIVTMIRIIDARMSEVLNRPKQQNKENIQKKTNNEIEVTR